MLISDNGCHFWHLLTLVLTLLHPVDYETVSRFFAALAIECQEPRMTMPRNLGRTFRF